MPYKNEKQRKEYHKEYHKKYYLKKINKIKKAHKNYRIKNKKQIAKYNKEYRLKNKEHMKKWFAAYARHQRKINPQVAMRERLSRRINDVLKCYVKEGKRFNTLIYTGCSIAFLVKHIEKQFKNGMNWENRDKWHLDHIRPCAHFDLTDTKQQLECFHYTNLQPLWAFDNLSKGKKIISGDITSPKT